MSYASVMVHVDVDGASNARVGLATALADRFAAQLIGVCATMLPAYPAEGAYFVTGEAVEQERRDVMALLARAETAFRATVPFDRADVEWRDMELPEFYVTSQARAADLLVVGRRNAPFDIACSLDPGSVVLRAGRPVLVVPPGIEKLSGARIIVAWKDTREARRALHDALPFLQRANAVTVVEIGDKESERERRHHLEDVARYLARHRVTVAPPIATHPAGSIVEELVRLAHAEEADLIVAGAYGHSRLGEWVFGGVTRDLLASSPLCCLLSH
jgi:nucleotide-binding universal stress UspA family protein